MVVLSDSLDALVTSAQESLLAQSFLSFVRFFFPLLQSLKLK